VGALAAIWLRQLLGGAMQLGAAALASLAVGAVALSASTLHLGRPAHAYRALKMWKRSWLSREVLMFSLFSSVAALYAGTLWFRLPGSAAFGALTAALGILGVTASACIYLVRARPAWNTKRTVAEFYLSAALLGPLFAASLGATEKRLLWVTVVAAIAQLFNMASKFLWLTRSDVFELQASARLFSTALASGLQLRIALLICGGIVLPLLLPGRIAISIALAIALAGEFLGRYLFFASVVPKNMAAAYLAGKKRAA
jgi:DMSO reductase anchor subunit